MTRLTDKQRTKALAADVEQHKERTVRQLKKYFAAHENHNGRAIYIVTTEEDNRIYDHARIDTRCPDLHSWFSEDKRDAKSAQALLNKTDYRKRALVPEALAGYKALVVEYVRVLKHLNAMKNAKQNTLV